MQRPNPKRSVIACALAISAAIPSFTQTIADGGLPPESRFSANVALPSIQAARKLTVLSQVEAPPSQGEAGTRSSPAARAAEREDGTQEASSRARLGRVSAAHEDPTAERGQPDPAAQRTRFGQWLSARFETPLVEAGHLSAAPLSIDRGELLRASLAGHLRASYWLLRHPELLLSPDEATALRESGAQPSAAARALRLELYRRFAAQAGNPELLAKLGVVGAMHADLASGWIDAGGAVTVLLEIEIRFPKSELAADSRLARALLLAEHGRGVARLEGLAARLFMTLVDDPRPGVAKAAMDGLWRLEHLRVGRVAPGFCGNDVAGNELCLWSFRRRVVFLRYWSEADADVASHLEDDARLVSTFWNTAVTIIGINRDPNRERYVRVSEALGSPGIQLYDGPLAEGLVPEIQARRADRPGLFDAWRETRPGATYLIDPHGVIRAVDPEPARLQELIDELVQESYRERRATGH